MTRLHFTVALLVAVSLEQAATGGELWPDSSRLQGIWNVEEVHQDGKAMEGNGGYNNVTIGIDKIAFHNLLKETPSFVYHTDPFKNPKHFDLFDERGKKLVEPGIYEFAGELLKICRGNPRPTEFRTKPNDGRILFVLKRKRDDGAVHR